MNRYLVQSSVFHLALLAFLIWNPFFRASDVVWLTPEFFGDGGGGDGRAGRGSGEGGTGITKTGPTEKEMGQPVPQPPVQQAVPVKPAPIQKETKAQETWKVDEKVKTVEPPVKKIEPDENVSRAETTQKEQSNVIRRGVADGTVAGAGGFNFGVEGPGIGIDPSGEGRGMGIGEGVGSGTGPGFGFGGYLKILRRRIWQEWSQSAVYGHKETCIVGLTVMTNGDVKDVKVEKASGNSFYDQVAVRAIRNSSPLPPLPSTFPGREQRFRIQFRLQE